LTHLLALVAGLLAVLLVPLALSGPTALLLLPAHLAFVLVTSTGAILDGLDGCPERARRWSLLYLVASILMVAALELGGDMRGAALGYWGIPWVGALVWGWIPPVVSAFAGAVGIARQRRLVTQVVTTRHAATRHVARKTAVS
jgi:hypothetical protein